MINGVADSDIRNSDWKSSVPVRDEDLAILALSASRDNDELFQIQALPGAPPLPGVPPLPGAPALSGASALPGAPALSEPPALSETPALSGVPTPTGILALSGAPAISEELCQSAEPVNKSDHHDAVVSNVEVSKVILRGPTSPNHKKVMFCC